MAKLNYDPNICWATHKVRLTLGMWDYRYTKTVTVGGNCRGLTIIESAIENLDLQLRELADKKDDYPEIWMTKPGHKMLVECDTDDEDWLKNMLIKAEIVDLQPKEKT